MRCPVCRASVPQGSSCPRCRSDLTPLWAIENHAQTLLTDAANLLVAGLTRPALAEIIGSQALQKTVNARRLEAIALLMNGDFQAALEAYDRLSKEEL